MSWVGLICFILGMLKMRPFLMLIVLIAGVFGGCYVCPVGFDGKLLRWRGDAVEPRNSGPQHLVGFHVGDGSLSFSHDTLELAPHENLQLTNREFFMLMLDLKENPSTKTRAQSDPYFGSTWAISNYALERPYKECFCWQTSSAVSSWKGLYSFLQNVYYRFAIVHIYKFPSQKST